MSNANFLAAEQEYLTPTDDISPRYARFAAAKSPRRPARVARPVPTAAEIAAKKARSAAAFAVCQQAISAGVTRHEAFRVYFATVDGK